MTTKKGAAYISGSITHATQLEKDMFSIVESALNDQGFTPVYNPLRHDEVKGFDPKECVENGSQRAAVLLSDCEFICQQMPTLFVLRSWRKSSGSKMEISLGKSLGLKIVYLRDTTF